MAMRIYEEYQNEARYSKFPFADTASLVDDNGHRLPDDFLLDASICLWGSSVPYLSSLTSGVGTFSAGGAAVARFDYTGPGTFPVFDISTGCEVGCVVLGPAASGIEEASFSPGSSVLCPACFCLFPSNKPVTTISCTVDGEEIELRGNVRLCGRNGVYVTKVGTDSLRVDVIGAAEFKSCCNNPLYSFIIHNTDCPAVSGTFIQEASSSPNSPASAVPGVVALYSPLTADTACKKREQYIDSEGNIGFRVCGREPLVPADPCIGINRTTFLVVASNGSIDFIPYSSVGGSALLVQTVRPSGTSSFVSGLQDPSMKNLALAENSGSVVIGFRGSD